MAWVNVRLQSKYKKLIIKNNEFANIYIGDGVKYGGPIFIPTEPADLEVDPEALPEQPEPNPDKEPVVPDDLPDGMDGGDPKDVDQD